jgi:hypothetical protein
MHSGVLVMASSRCELCWKIFSLAPGSLHQKWTARFGTGSFDILPVAAVIALRADTFHATPDNAGRHRSDQGFRGPINRYRNIDRNVRRD